MAISGVSGLASGINSGEIIDALIKADRGTTRLLETRKATFKARLDAVLGFNTRLLSAQLDLGTLKRASTFQARTATSSAATVLGATATSKAQPGTYAVTVDQQAKGHQVTSGGFASSTATIGTGDVVLQLGNGTATTITLTAANSSLEGLASEINTRSSDISAQVINDGSAKPYRLVLTSRQTGAEHTIAFNADALVGGASDELQKVVAVVGGATTSSLTSSGFFSGANGPKEYLVEADAGGTAGVAGASATFRWSSDGGSTWTTGGAAVAGALTLGNGVSVTFAAGDLTTGDRFTVRPLQQLSEAQDAQVRYGSAGSYVSVTSATNTISDLIGGVSLSIVGPGTSTVTIGADTTSAKDAVTKFIESYNTAAKYLGDNASYNPETKQAGILLSETDLRRALDGVTRSLFDPIANLPTSLNSLTAIGVSLDRKTGLLLLDQAKLDTKLATDPDGVMRMFTNTGTSSNSSVQFGALTDKTKVSSAFSVDITIAAAQARVATTGSLAASTVITAANNQLNLTINGNAVTASLAAGTYSRDQLVEQVAAAVNAAVTQQGDRITVALNGTAIDLRSALYGSSQTIAVTGGSANADLMLSTTTAIGIDVDGTIDGIATSGTGQVLNGVVGQRSEGMRLTVTSAVPLTGVTITARKGVAQVAGERVTAMTSTDTGSITAKEDGFNDIIDGIDKRITAMDARLALRQKRYESTFLQMEKLIQSFQSQGNFITGQIRGFENMASSRANG